MAKFYINFIITTITSPTFETFHMFQYSLFFGSGISLTFTKRVGLMKVSAKFSCPWIFLLHLKPQ